VSAPSTLRPASDTIRGTDRRLGVRIEDYGFIGDTQTGALVGRDGAVDWLCLPRYDSASCCAALVGDDRHGRWRLAPAGAVGKTSRRYRSGTLVLETDFETEDGAVRVIDFMPRRADGPPRLMRIVEGLRGRVPMHSELSLRPDYGSITPWVERAPDGVVAIAGPDAFRLSTPLALELHDGTVGADFVVVEGARERLTLTWHTSFEPTPAVEDADSALARTEAWWRAWSGRCTYQGPYRDAVLVSLMALKAMTSEMTGAVIAAPTTSLPEDVGGVRNWDYRYCWLRDSVLALEALLAGGYTDEALGFRDFLFRAGTGDPAKVQIMYGIGGERRLTEFELDELPGYEGSKPVRVGNAASEQFQLDVYGEVLGVAYRATEMLGHVEAQGWPRWRRIIEYVESIWREPDDGIWESRGPRRHYTYSKVMAWVVFDRGVRIVERLGLAGPVERWKQVRDEIHREVCEQGYDAERQTFTQYYGSRELDASVLNIPLVGFLPGSDERVTGTIDAIRRDLGRDGFVARYSTAETDDGLPGSEGQFLACSFWLVNALARNGRVGEARELFERLLGLSNDLGLLAEEYDVDRGRQVGNFPQAFSHLTLIGAAYAIAEAEAEHTGT
jgi:GH15 family glucan-1,4-alpha-glucosidase